MKMLNLKIKDVSLFMGAKVLLNLEIKDISLFMSAKVLFSSKNSWELFLHMISILMLSLN